MTKPMPRKIQENMHNPGFTYGNLVTLINQIRAADPREEGTDRLDAAFSSNDTVIFLGALGAAEIPGWVDYGYEGGDTDTAIPDFASDPNMAPGVGGYIEPWSGAVRLPVDAYLRLMQGTPNLSDANATVHEIMHRGIAMLYRLTNSYDELRTMLPNDLFTQWAGGWGEIDYTRYPMVDVTDSTGAVTNSQMQINPEHAMIYSMTSTANGFYDRLFVQTIPQLSWGARYFTTEWHANFNDRYDDLTRDRPTTDLRRMRTYWRILYYNMERGLSRFLRSVLNMPPNISSSPRPQPRPGTQPPRGQARPAAQGSMAELLGLARPSSGYRPLSDMQRRSLLNRSNAVRNSEQIFRGTTVRLPGGQTMTGEQFHVSIIVPFVREGNWEYIEFFLDRIEIQ